MSQGHSFRPAAGPIRVNAGERRPLPEIAGLSFADNGETPIPAPLGLNHWNPPLCGDSRMRIAGDGTWFHEGEPIRRPALVRLFSSILRHDPEGFVLVTPVEKLTIAVEDAPFLAVEMRAGPEQRPVLGFRTNVGEAIAAGETHPLRFEADAQGGTRPYLLVRGGLWARLTRAVTYELLSRAEERLISGQSWLGVASGDMFFPIEDASGA